MHTISSFITIITKQENCTPMRRTVFLTYYMEFIFIWSVLTIIDILNPNPDMITKINVVPATGIAGVPIATQINRNAAVISWVGVILIPAAVAPHT